MRFWRRRKKDDTSGESVVPPAEPGADEGDVDVDLDLDLGIVPGMTRQEVVTVLGPPLDYLSLLETSRTGSHVVISSSSRSGRLPDSVSWLYLDVPEPGVKLEINFEDGALNIVRAHPHERSPEHHVERQDWTRDLVRRHLSRVEHEPPDPRLVDLPGWNRLASDEVLEFVTTTHLSPRGSGLIGRGARRFGDLDLIVSFYELVASDRLRAAMSGDYRTELATLLDGFALTRLECDVAHWIFGRTPEGNTIAHLAYIPRLKDVTGLLPTDLLG